MKLDFLKTAVLNVQAASLENGLRASQRRGYTGRRKGEQWEVQEGTANEIRGYKSEKENARAIGEQPPGRESYERY